MSGAIVGALFLIHAIFALVWRDTMIAGIFPALTLLKPDNANVALNSTTSFKRGIMLSRIVAAAGGIALVFGIILYYYINFVDKTYATSSSGIPLIGAAFGIVTFVLSTYQSPKLRRAYRGKSC